MRENSNQSPGAHRAPETKIGETRRLARGWRDGFLTFRELIIHTQIIWK